jgi:hypothetical protein
VNVKRFRAGNDRVLTLPVSLASAPGANHMRLTEFDVVEIDFDSDNYARNQRFVSMALRDGDLVEMKDDEKPAEKPVAAAKPKRPTPSVFEVNPPPRAKE